MAIRLSNKEEEACVTNKKKRAYVECRLENLVAEGSEERLQALASNREELLHMHAQLMIIMNL
jgi:hypothetical protein